tara:strand:+ start:3032 stop:3355 length:324 start_codon:yes stop_codon:yes gene_type:complete
MYWEESHRETAAGFDIVLFVTTEDMPHDWDETEEERADTLRRIDSGDLVYFVARVEARKEGITLGTAYLGGCCYDSVQKFVDASDYYGDMVEEAVQEARTVIDKLTA